MNEPRPSELLDAINSLFDGTLAPQDVAQLTQQLSEDEKAYALYARLVRLDVGLAWSCGTRPKQENFAAIAQSTPPASPSRAPVSAKMDRSPVIQLTRRTLFFSRPILQRVAVAAICFYGSFMAIAWNLRSGAAPTQTDSRGDASVAVIGSTTDARWSEETPTRAVHSSIRSGESLKLDHGIVEVELKRGATIVMEAPAEWVIDGDNHATLRRGKLLARVPHQAIGFTVDTPTATVTDLGTEFGVEVDDRGTAEVHVFKGRVVAQFNGQENPTSQRVELKSSEAARFGVGETTVKKLAAAPERFQQKPGETPPQSVAVQPDSLPGLQLWLKADAGVYANFSDDGNYANDVLAKPGDRVEGWRDWSGHNRHAMQSADSKRPTFQSNVLRLPVLRFDASQWLERLGKVLDHADPSSFTIMVAFNAASIPDRFKARGALFCQCSPSTNVQLADDSSRYFGLHTAARLFYDEFRPLGGGFLGDEGSVTANISYIGTLVRDQAASSMHLATFGRGTVSNSQARGDNYSGAEPTVWRVGARHARNDLDAFHGEIAEMVIYDRPLSSSERHNLEKYLSPKLFFAQPVKKSN